MGFFSDASQVLGGGSQSSSSGSSQSGFSLLPQEIQTPYKNYGNLVNDQLNQQSLTNMYTPIGQTAGETQAYNNINNGFTPTASSLQSDIAMQQNPYQQSVIDQINRQYQGQNSLTNQALNAAGQQNSNRSILGANDIDLSRTNQIGSMLSTQYNTALQNALTTLPQLRQQDATAQLGAGANQRQLALQQSTAPITGLQQIGSALGVLPTNGGSTSTNSSESTSNKGLFSSFAG